jgi:outer membrane lipopolysaccharide assembly protein LptE/RlpB
MIRIAAACLLALLVSACGFHLRNALTLPPDLGPVRVESRDPYSPLALSLQQALRRAGAEVVEGRARDVAVLDIISERWGNVPLSVDARGRAQEYTCATPCSSSCAGPMARSWCRSRRPNSRATTCRAHACHRHRKRDARSCRTNCAAR